MWFEQLFGFSEQDPDSTRARLALSGDQLQSRVNGATFRVGRFSTPSLSSLRAGAAALALPRGRGRGLRLRHEAVGDVLGLHALPENEGALFQVASQFNCLEFPGPSTVPEDGVTGYAHDPTQGPACALAAAAATVYRHLFVPVKGGIGQSRDRQIDNTDGLRAALGEVPALWDTKNGYTFSSAARLSRLRARLEALDPAARETLMGALEIGLQTGVGVTFSSRFVPLDRAQSVSQAFCSALSCAYSGLPNGLWEPFARLVLEGAYEATLLAAAIERAEGAGSGRVWLTFLGGGAFGNDSAWITDAIGRALSRAAGLDLDVRVAHYKSVNRGLAAAVEAAAGRG
jgi:hypothetical protein